MNFISTAVLPLKVSSFLSGNGVRRESAIYQIYSIALGYYLLIPIKTSAKMLGESLLAQVLLRSCLIPRLGMLDVVIIQLYQRKHSKNSMVLFSFCLNFPHHLC